MRVGTWREVDLSAYVRGALWAAGLTAVAVAISEELHWLAIGPILGGAFAAILMRARGGAAKFDDTGETHAPHRGPNASRIPVSGLPGLVLVVGFVWMFWFGVPAFRPVVIGIAIVGGLAGILLIWTARRHRAPASTILNITPRHSAGAGSKAEAALRRAEHFRPAAEQRDGADEVFDR